MARTDPKKAGKRMALCGIFSALAIVIMFLFSLIGVGAYGGPFVASLLLIPIVDEYDAKTALVCYAAVAALGLMVLPDRELAVFYLCYGWYPVAETFISLIDSKLAQILVKLVIYAAIIGTVYGIMAKLMGFSENVPEEMMYGYAAIAIAGFAIFLFISKAFYAVRYQWHGKWRHRLMK